MNIAILGGSFDPPHRGHAAIANRLLKLFHFDQVWLMPCYQHPFSKPGTESAPGKNLSAPNKRFEMTKYLKNDKVKVSDLEIRRKKISYTINTLNSLTTQYPNDHFSWIIGTDQVENFTKWREWKKIIDDFKLIVVPRTDFDKAKKELKNITKQVIHPENILFIDRREFPPVYVSSRFVRARIKNGDPISNLVPKEVEKYIIQHKLYL